MDNQSKWNWQEVSDRYLRIAEEAERYMEEVRQKMGDSLTYQMIFDEHLAKFYVYNNLHGKLFLETKELLIEEVTNLLKTDSPIPRDAYDAQRFLHYRQIYLRGILDSLVKPNT